MASLQARSFSFSLLRLTRSRAPKFLLPLPLLTPATQAMTLIVQSYFDTLLRYVLSVTF